MPATPVRLTRISSVVAALSLATAVAWGQTAPATAPALSGVGPAASPAGSPSNAPGTLQIGAPSTMPALPSVPASPPATPAAPVTSMPAGGGAAAAAPPAGELPPVTQPFVASVTGDKVYVRSGPSATTYYEIGQLTKGDLVYVVGTSKGWYQILPPNGAYCLIAKEYVDVDNTGAGTVKADYVNVRAGTAIYKTRDTSILTIARKGTRLKIVGGGGANDKYYEVAPPDHAYFYVAPQFLVKAGPGAEYKVPDLKLPPGVSGPSQPTVTAPTTLPTATIEIPNDTRPVAGTGGTPPALVETIVPPVTTTHSAPATEPRVVDVTPVPVPVPAVTFSATATQRFNELNTQYQDELKKPVAQQNVDELLKNYKALLGMENLSPSVKMGSEARISQLEKTLVMQRLIKNAASNDDELAKERAAMQQQYVAAEKAIADYQANSPYAFQGVLQSSTIVQGKYALVNPATGRTVAYVDPQSEIDIGTLLGKYIGVRGFATKPEGSDITVVRVTTATMMPAPKP